MRIGPDLVVELGYEIRDDDGEQLESSAELGPLVYVHGRGELPDALERALEGAEPGACLELTLEPSAAFGEYDLESLFSVPRVEFPAEPGFAPGDWLDVKVEFEADEKADAREAELTARVVEVGEESVILDANHPLAGKRLRFAVEVLEVRRA